MKILLTNDDGIEAAGIKALIKIFAENHEVYVCAPLSEQSGMSHALTVRRRMEFRRRSDIEKLGATAAWCVDGTPADCVKSFLESICADEKFAAVVSGINSGHNLATDVIYSGTVGAAREGFMHGVNAFALSCAYDSKITFDEAAVVGAEYITDALASSADAPIFLNINFPWEFANGKAKRANTVLGRRDYLNAYRVESDADGKTYFSVHGTAYDFDDGEHTDVFAVKQGRVSVTSLTADMKKYLIR